MTRPIFKSVFADEINNYLDYKVTNGNKEISFYYILHKFDNFIINRKINTINFTKDDADAWYQKNESESNTTHYARINKTKTFIEYLNLKGYSLCPLQNIAFKATDFKPHIYTDDEITRYFNAADVCIINNRFEKIQIPVLFRIMYCCGTRINETLGIRKCDVDIKNGIIRLSEAKNGDERFIVLNEELKSLLFQYKEKCFYMFDENDYIFPSSVKSRKDPSRLYDIHRIILLKAGIPYIGGGHGPRIHDWRHTFAVRAFKQMIDQGMDMYVALPILSTYLGHKTIYATERYIRLTFEIYPYIEKLCSEKFNKVFGKEFLPYETE